MRKVHSNSALAPHIQLPTSRLCRGRYQISSRGGSWWGMGYAM